MNFLIPVLAFVLMCIILYLLINRSTLSRSINTLLDQLQSTQSSLQEKIQDAQNSNRAMINILEDEHHLETSLKNERDQAQTLISSMGEGLLVIDTNNKITVINPVAEKLLGLPSSQAITKSWFDLVTTLKNDVETPLSERSFSQTLLQGKTIITKLEDKHYYKTTSGTIFPVVSITAPIIRDNQVVGAIKLFHDATAEKEATQLIEDKVTERTKELNAKNLALEKAKTQISDGWLQLQNEKARLTASLTSLPLGFILTDIHSQIIFQNAKVATIINGNVSDFLKQFKIDNNPTEIKEFVQESKILRLYFTPIIVETESIGAAILIEDITEAKILERSKDEFFSIASHELRTPLTAIRGNSSLLTDYYADQIQDPNAKEMITDIHDASVRLIGIVNDFLNLSRLETGKITFKLSLFPINPLVQEVVQTFLDSNPNPNIKLLNLITDNSITVNADTERTREVLTNLIGNAYKYTEKGEINISAKPIDHQLQIDISDTGRGIAPAQQTLLFRKFQQAGENLFTRDTTKSTGLGLYISKLIIEGMSGKIWLSSSTPSVGSTFSFTLPKTPSP